MGWWFILCVFICQFVSKFMFFFPKWVTLTRSGVSTVRTSRHWVSTPSPWRILLTTTGPKTAKERDASSGVGGTVTCRWLQMSFSCVFFNLVRVQSDSSRPVGCAFVTCPCNLHSNVSTALQQCLSRILSGWRDEKNVRKGWEKCHTCYGSDCSICKCPTAQHHSQVSCSQKIFCHQ